ncbi:tetratricopeptide repeat protein [Clostridium tertium]|uniref:tetratricopeptide repeat protein n=1 Tax=Clostridium TaxID=1485 RepID=UPI0018AC6CDA|nr:MULTISPECIES: tetratricopeptide repeat protein [Clostridium]MDB1922273.1 tetratricopeptide repeat protein [Clostridium tertium]MDB1926881.1 tetratricopeptide repeat protein [Clostridium tertium]MDB1929876.1 tetratricopeptide repeat protein [Clostridium tertium]MDB1933462.1 tetratricopeptide repeat protein [Clostridium tertium]MDB1937390.1 tetratricopeptide repeat protein [Clostridium tertium]
MKETDKLFSTIIKCLKPFVKKLKIVIKPLGKSINRTSKKINNTYKKMNEKNPYIEPVVMIGIPCLFVLTMILGIKSFTTVEEINITKNSAEYLYYENKYDESIEEYNKMQKEENWPIWTVKSADIYSIKGDIKKSSSLLKEAIIKRDRIIKEEGFDNYKDKDIELINSMLFTFIMNKEYDEAISLGEQYINEYGRNKEILKTLFAAYISNNHIYKAEMLTEEYPIDEKSAYDVCVLANMNMLINRWDKGLELLKDAWYLDKNELKIYDVIEDMSSFNNEKLIESIQAKIENNTNEDAYKMLLAKAYSVSKETANDAEELMKDLDDNNVDGIASDFINYEICKSRNNNSEAEEYLEEAERKAEKEKKDSYVTYYISAVKAFNNEKYEEAFNLAKKSIIANQEYTNNYESLIPDILLAKGNIKPTEAYFRTAMKKEPYNYETIIKIANYYSNYESNNEKARNYYELALNIKKDDSELYFKLAKLDIVDEKWEDASNNLKEAIKIEEDNPEYYRTLGAVYLKSSKNEEGIELTRKAYSMNEKDILALNNAGWYYLMVENDIARGYENIKAAYEEIPASMDESTKNSLIENYNKSKEVYDKFLKDSSQEFKITGLKLFY